MKSIKLRKTAALALASAMLLAGCGNDPPAEETIATVGTAEQTQPSSAAATSTARTTSARTTAATTEAATTTEDEPVLTNAPAAGDEPYAPGIYNPPSGG